MIKPLYKAIEPFMEVKRGHGYQGVVMYDDIEDKLQCHICGKFYENLGQHIWMGHKIKSADYKIDFGASDAARMVNRNRRHGHTYRRQGGAMLMKNRHGLCELQIKHRYQVVCDLLGRHPMQDEIMRYDKKLFHCGIVPNYKNLNRFRESIGVQPKKWEDYSKIGVEKLIAELRRIRFDEHKLPTTSMFMNGNRNGKPSIQCYYRTFGSWTNALRMAGLK